TINSVGTNDKVLLLLGIYVLLAALGAAVGALAMANLVAGLAGVALIGAFGVYCALTANGSRSSDVIPTVIGTLASAAVLTVLVRLAHRSAAGEPPGDHVAMPARRAFLFAGLATGALAALSGFGGQAAQRARYSVAAARRTVRLPAATGDAAVQPGADLGRSGVAWATPSGKFYRIDTALDVPQIDPGSWRLRVHGMVDREITLSFKELLARPMIERWITLSCVSNPVGGPLVSNALFRGTRLADLMREAGLQPQADQLLLRSYDGYTFGAPAAVVMDGRDALLAVGMNGEPLPLEHGFPVRTVVPGLYGYVSACKWIVDIEATTFAAAAAYWVQGGWATHPPIELASRIDAPRSHADVPVGKPVAVAGVAWDQHVGVSKVEIQVDDGPWERAQLATVPSTDTWRQWYLSWTPPRSGQYQLRVRATDGHGHQQDVRQRDPFPSGATGLHTITVRASA
ncbi:MAG TPA: molybdopterin-dependent oxidoreductase, partial [Jatrophihabitans sp.]|nr:molybdopterin-dependent oxidoreductase [Jatrophihabitans sp.]